MQKTQTIQEQLSSLEVILMVRQWLEKNKSGGRRALAQYLCQELDLRDPVGKPRLAGVHKALRVLESRGYWQLPEPLGVLAQRWQARRLEEPVASPQGVPWRVEAVKGLQLVEVSSQDDELFRIWNELMLSEHPLHNCRLVGRQLRYLIGSDHGWLGGMGLGSCALRFKVRDRWLGWDEPTRKSFQERLINLTRFLIRPQVQCQNLASRVLSLCLDRVGRDFAQRYGFEPWWVETFVDRERYSGTCFRAANWRYIGASQGRGRSAPNRQVTSCKDLYLYELKPDWRRSMGLPVPSEEIEPVKVQEALQSESWVADEFGQVDFGHKATERRLLRIVGSKAENPSASYTECFGGNRHQLKAYYRFIGNEREQICAQGILAGHHQRTVGRIKDRKRALAIQDSTDLDFSKRLHCNGLGVIGKNQTGAVSAGLKMHSCLALGEEGLPLGVLNMQIYAPEVGANKAPNRPIEEKESYRWLRTLEDLSQISESLPQTELICIGDRESDIFELFDYRRRRARKVHLLVRANYNRCLQDESQKLFDHLADLPVMAKAHLKVPRQREKKSKPSQPGRIGLAARRAHVELKWKKVTVAAPNTVQTKDLPAVELYAVEVFEPHPPKGAKALHWVLLSTVPIDSRKQALRCLRWYTLRWRIEEWHRVLKSGCHIESHQHRSAQRLARAIAIDAVIAWRVMLLTLLGREVPEIPCELIFSPWECQLLETLQPMLAPETMEGQKKGL
ncbi:IS4 family transposase [Acidobacteria bacterium AH-259-G07]|nr:IS4 family transposase [Acidobacteria bacterium AH-259-G07]